MLPMIWTDKMIKDTCLCCLRCVTQARVYPQQLQSLASWRRWIAITESQYFLHAAKFAKYRICVGVGGHSSFLFRLVLIFSEDTFSLLCKIVSSGNWHTVLSPVCTSNSVWIHSLSEDRFLTCSVNLLRTGNNSQDSETD